MNEIHTSQNISSAAISLYLHISKHFLRSFQIIVSKNHECIKSYQFLKLLRPEINLEIFGYIASYQNAFDVHMYQIPILGTVQSRCTDKLRFTGYFAKY